MRADSNAAEQELIEKDIEAYLSRHENKELLRFLTCGSVDDGKSTLIGRLLHDTHMIHEDTLQAAERDSKSMGTQSGALDLALLVDGLKSEREQGITIDVAYHFFSTDRRSFIVADTPGTTLLDPNELVCPGGRCRERLAGAVIRSDGVHLDPGPGGDAVTDWIVARTLEIADLDRAGTTTTGG